MLVFLTLFFIGLYDLRTHKITNVSLILLVLFSLTTYNQQFQLSYAFITLMAVSIFTVVSRCGFGDSKLAIIVLNLIIPPTQVASFLFNLTIATAFMVSAHVAQTQTFRGNIAFAPAICGAVLALAP